MMANMSVQEESWLGLRNKARALCAWGLYAQIDYGVLGFARVHLRGPLTAHSASLPLKRPARCHLTLGLLVIPIWLWLS